MTTELAVFEICAGAGGQARGLELAGFTHEMAVEIDPNACETLRRNRPAWNVHEGDVREVSGRELRGIDLLAGGVPCPPFSMAGKQLGQDDERDLIPEMLRLVREAQPSALLLENVRGLASAKFADYRAEILDELCRLGYHPEWQVINASEHGVPQLRPRFILMAVKVRYASKLAWPSPIAMPSTVGEALLPLMAREGWEGARAWAKGANGIGPTLVGGSRKHGGADLGPTRARAAWLELGVDGSGVADLGPNRATPFGHIPRLTLQMAARIQGFDKNWHFAGRKTAAYRQIGNAFPPPVARAIGGAIRGALGAGSVGADSHLRAV